ncbi:hypothetical protein KAF25_001905 [Fusarium avenaceum]|uniref:Heterokaryon incompatibility domain-containing protein n=1 Tax=Fusarium avenaceum TaxID=40199 RepID=A0A9P7GY67_9HYPO|nr:hypothetical protein KAF25_001905 [Fusarium avenaceum]
MGLCDVCSEALKEVYSGLLRHSTTRINITHPQHNQQTRHACWICTKYSLWLDEHYLETFQSWKSGQLLSALRPESYSIIPEEEGSRIISLSFTLQPVNSTSLAELELVIRLFSTQEYESSTSTGLQTTCPTHWASIAKTWLNQCITTHEECMARQKRLALWYPTRLLLLGTAHDDVRLVVSAENNMEGPYMTLSHRWGDTSYTKLTAGSLEQFKNRIDISDLPVSFKETMHIARLARVKYLWIDSLCIQQDDDEKDWEVEAQLMGKVYSHSFLNVSATLGDDDTRSLFNRSSHPFDPTLLNLPCIKRRFRKAWIVDQDVWEDEIEQGPLQSRGWVFQERFLSPRILHFAERQLAWECHQTSALEMFPSRVPPGLIQGSRSDIADKVLAARVPTNANLLEFCRSWNEIVAKYTTTELTFKKDKLVAFARVAKTIEVARGDIYLAGLWKSAFISQLAWTRTRDDIVHYPRELSSGRAPSWSWLSVDGGIINPYPEMILKYFANVAVFPDPVFDSSSAITASGSVVLRGILLPINSVNWDKEDIVSGFTVDGFTFQPEFYFSGTHLDLEGTKDQIIQLVKSGIALVPLFATDEHMQCIAVACIKTIRGIPMDFRRVGACQVQYRKIHVLQGSIPPGWEEDPSIRFCPVKPSCNLIHPVARSLIRSVELNLSGKRRPFKLW